MNYKHNPALTANAKSLRRNMTKEERHLWYDFLKLLPVRFLRQKVIDNYVVDFYCAKAKLVIELDGSQHYEKNIMEYDSKRDGVLSARGLQVIRVSNKEVNEKFREVCEYISEIIRQRTGLEVV